MPPLSLPLPRLTLTFFSVLPLPLLSSCVLWFFTSPYSLLLPFLPSFLPFPASPVSLSSIQTCSFPILFPISIFLVLTFFPLLYFFLSIFSSSLLFQQPYFFLIFTFLISSFFLISALMISPLPHPYFNHLYFYLSFPHLYFSHLCFSSDFPSLSLTSQPSFFIYIFYALLFFSPPLTLTYFPSFIPYTSSVFLPIPSRPAQWVRVAEKAWRRWMNLWHS